MNQSLSEEETKEIILFKMKVLRKLGKGVA